MNEKEVLEKGFRIRLKGPEQSRMVQEVMLKKGWKWGAGEKGMEEYADKPFLMFYPYKNITYLDGKHQEYFNDHELPEVTFRDFENMFLLPMAVRVTSNQSRVVQQFYLDRGWKWNSGNTTFMNYGSTILHFDKDKIITHSSILNKKMGIPEVTFEQFRTKYLNNQPMNKLDNFKMKLSSPGQFDKVSEIMLKRGWTWRSPVSESNRNQYSILAKKENHPYLVVGDENAFNKSDVTEITLGQFIKESGEEVAGYICPADMFGGKVKKGDIYIKTSTSYGIEDNSIEYNMPAEIVETWEPYLGKKETVLKFGEVEFTIVEGEDHAMTSYGKVTREEIKRVLDYVSNPPKLAGYTFSINKERGYLVTDTQEIFFGCQRGTLGELKVIFDKLQVKTEEIGHDRVKLDRDITVNTSKGITLLQTRVGGEYRGISFWLSSNFNWEIKRDSGNEICLIPTIK